MSGEESFTIRLEQMEGYQFMVRFDLDDAPELLVDNQPPLGRGEGPNASRLLAAAVVNCLSASLMYCLVRADAPEGSMRSSITCHMTRNEQGRLRVGSCDVTIAVSKELEEGGKLGDCLNTFQQFSVVAESVRQGIEMNVDVVGEDGTSLLVG